MINRRTTVLTLAAAFVVTLFLPFSASAQGGPWWGQDRNDDYRRDRDRRYGGGYDNYDRRTLRDAARRIEDRSKNFERNLDRFLDDSRYDDSRREDRINQDVREFRNAADRFENRVDDERNLNRSSGEARTLLQAATRVDRIVSRLRLDSRTYSDWSQIRQDLRTIANIYGFRTRDFGDDRNDRNRWPNRLPNRWPF